MSACRMSPPDGRLPSPIRAASSAAFVASSGSLTVTPSWTPGTSASVALSDASSEATQSFQRTAISVSSPVRADLEQVGVRVAAVGAAVDDHGDVLDPLQVRGAEVEAIPAALIRPAGVDADAERAALAIPPGFVDEQLHRPLIRVRRHVWSAFTGMRVAAIRTDVLPASVTAFVVDRASVVAEVDIHEPVDVVAGGAGLPTGDPEPRL